MKGKSTTILMVLAIILVLVGNPDKLKAQTSEMSMSVSMEFWEEWATISPMMLFIPGLFAYNETLYEGEKVTSNECIKVDEAIGTIASVMKKACAEVKNESIKKDMQLAADNYIIASKLYADYHKTGKEESKDKADKLVDVASEHWEKIGEQFDNIWQDWKEDDE